MRAVAGALLLACVACTQSGTPSPPAAGSAAPAVEPVKLPTEQVTPKPPPKQDSAPKVDEAFDPAHTYAVVIGVLHWKDTSFASFPPEDRKDKALFELLGKRGVPAAQRVLLLDEDATTEHALAAVDRMIAAAPAGSTFVFYFAGHGGPVGRDDVALATYDAVGDDFGMTGLTVSALAKHLAPFRGSTALLLGDACYTGGLQAAARALADKGVHAAALTSASSANTSTANWTFTQTILDGLSGRALLDTDGDGAIRLDELAADVADAMANRENQRHGYANFGVPSTLRLAAVTPDAVPLERAIAGIARGTWVKARNDVKETIEPAHVLGAHDGKVVVAFYDYATETQRAFLPRDVQPYSAHLADTMEVEWKGRWYAAVKTGTDGNLTCIHYVGYEASWDECVEPNRIR